MTIAGGRHARERWGPGQEEAREGRQPPTSEAGGRWRHAPDHGWMQARSNVIYASENCEDFHVSV
jgi:hypothetical protein